MIATSHTHMVTYLRGHSDITTQLFDFYIYSICSNCIARWFLFANLIRVFQIYSNVPPPMVGPILSTIAGDQRLRVNSDHLLKHVRIFAAGGGYSLLWPGATTFLRHWGAYSWPNAATVACDRKPQGFITQKCQLKIGTSSHTMTMTS